MSEYILKTTNLTKTYKGYHAVNNVSIALKPGKIYGLVGRNGAGKSTLMRLIAGLSYPSSGEIELFGHTKESKIQVERRRMGCMIESPSINLSMTAKENMRLHRIIRGIPNEEIEDELLKLLDIANTGKKKVKNFSLGMKQRLGIAITLLNNPEFLILDEPINGLDPLGIVEIRKLLIKLCDEKNMTILISSHNLPEMYQLANDYIFINKGEIIETLTLEELDEHCKHYLLLQSTDVCKLVNVIERKLNTNNFKVMPDNSVQLFDYIDDKELAKEDVPVDIKIHADLKVFMSALLQELLHQGIKKQHQDWVRRCHDWKEKYPVVQSGYASETPLNEYYFTKLLSEETSGNANVIVDTGSVCNIVSQTWIIKENQRYLISGGLSCMGFWATSIGAVQEGRQTIAITGDGSAQMNIQELATLQYNKLPIKLFVYNNNGYMLIRHNQHNYMNDRFIGVGPDSGLRTPDFYKVADAYGLKSIRIVKGDNIQDRIRQVLEAEEPVLCEVMVQEFAPIIPRIASKVMPDGSLKAADFDDLYPFLDNKDKELI